MSAEKEKETWVQCTECGKVYSIYRSIPIERMYVACFCPRCEHTKGLNLGDSVEDKYLYMDINMDERYYKY